MYFVIYMQTELKIIKKKCRKKSKSNLYCKSVNFSNGKHELPGLFADLTYGSKGHLKH